jgi:hypothetical protein
MLSGTITLYSSQFPTGTPLVIELLDGELNRRWQGAAIVNEPVPFPTHLATGDSVISVALPSGQSMPIPLKPTDGEPGAAIHVDLPRRPEKAMSSARDWQSAFDRTLDNVWVRLWSRDAVRRWKVRRWKPAFRLGTDGSVSVEFDADELRPGQHFLQIGTGMAQPRMTAIPAGGATVVLRPVPRCDDDAAELAVDIDVDAGTPEARSVLSYLSNGDLERAQIVGNDLLLAHPADDDRLDLTTALLGAYYLLACRDMDRLDHLVKARVSSWAAWLPDCAVIAAWRCLRQDQPDAEQAREQLVVAARCGLPIYTRGLRLMVDGLRMIEADEALCNEAARWAGKRLRKFASVANWRARFTTFFAAHPDRPINPGASVRWLTEGQRARSDPLSRFPWGPESRTEPPEGQASRDQFGNHLSAAFSRAFASPSGNVSAAEAYRAFHEGITNLSGATP